MKAIHNRIKYREKFCKTVFNHPKIQNESNSQHTAYKDITLTDCI